MEMFVNECSFTGQCTDFDSEVSIINDLVNLIDKTSSFRNYRLIRRAECLRDVFIADGRTLHLLISELLVNPKHVDLGKRMLLHFAQRPYIKDEEMLLDFEELVSAEGDCLIATSMHAAISTSVEGVMPVIISAKNTPAYDDEFISVLVDGEPRLILNFTSEDMASKYERFYEENEKHSIPEDRVVSGETYTRMDLSAEDAQPALVNGIELSGEKSIFSYWNESWYQFPPHEVNRYHGYPLGTPENNNVINRIIRVLGAPPYETRGHVIIN